jgi:hypothetical protein
VAADPAVEAAAEPGEEKAAPTDAAANDPAPAEELSPEGEASASGKDGATNEPPAEEPAGAAAAELGEEKAVPTEVDKKAS